MDGFELTKEIRKSNPRIPILMLTALGSTNDKLDGFDAGADDYMVKPGDFSGLLMRVRALLRRANIEASRKLSVDGLLLYADALTASLAGAEIPVTIREFNILYELLSCPNRTFPLRAQAEVLWQRQTH